MAFSLSKETQKLVEERMKETGLSTPDEVVQIALQTLEQMQREPYDDLPAEVRTSIEVSEAQYARGEGIPADEAFARLRRKHFGQSS